MTSGDNRSLVWTAFDMPASIARSAQTLVFAHDAEHQRILQTGAADAKRYYNDPINGARAELRTSMGGGSIGAGEHAHVHNIESLRGRGDLA